MNPRHAIIRALSIVALFGLVACTSVSYEEMTPASRSDVADLASAIEALAGEVDREEATRAAQIAYDYPLQLAREYQLTDPPLIHNIKVNNGTRPRGLCYHWADDLQARLAQEGFETLTLHRAIANADNPILIDYSTVIISGKDDGLFEGIVLDPWRNSSALFWSPVLGDERYTWVPRQVVLENRRQSVARRAN